MIPAKFLQHRNARIRLESRDRGGYRRYRHVKSGELSPYLKDSDDLSAWFREVEKRRQPLSTCPTSAGLWYSLERDRDVLVEETVAAGRYCRELRQGGSQQCGFQPWSGLWRYIGATA